MLIKADKHGKIDRSNSVDIYRKGEAIVHNGNINLYVKVVKNGGMFELWALEEGGAKRMYSKGLTANDAWCYCIEIFGISANNVI